VIWVISLSEHGYPIVASSSPSDVGKNAAGIPQVAGGATSAGATTQLVIDGGNRLVTMIQIASGERAVVVFTSLTAEAAAAHTTAALISLAVLAACVLEILATMLVLETGVMRRLRRIRAAVHDFGQAVEYGRYRKGDVRRATTSCTTWRSRSTRSWPTSVNTNGSTTSSAISACSRCRARDPRSSHSALSR
jgi:hypothetical protein